MTEFLRFVLSISGLLCALLVGIGWAALGRDARAPRAFFVSVVLLYSLASIYPLPHALARQLASPYRPLQSSDVPAGRNAVVILGSGSFTAHDWNDQYTVSL